MHTESRVRKQALFCSAAVSLVVGVLVAQLTSVNAQTAPVNEQQAHAIAVDSYIYFYPLVTMDLTRRQMTNLPVGKELGFGPPNTFNNVPAYPSASDWVV